MIECACGEKSTIICSVLYNNLGVYLVCDRAFVCVHTFKYV